jgi:hypothetical protein
MILPFLFLKYDVKACFLISLLKYASCKGLPDFVLNDVYVSKGQDICVDTEGTDKESTSYRGINSAS